VYFVIFFIFGATRFPRRTTPVFEVLYFSFAPR
jgi:hypothetical protein